MKKNDFSALIVTMISEANESERNAQIQVQAATTADDVTAAKALVSKFATRAQYLNKLNNEDCAAAQQKIKMTEAQFRSIATDSYMIEKCVLTILCLVQKVKVSMSCDDALAQALEALTSKNFASVTSDELRKRIFSKKSNYTETHTTARQSSMILNLFTRLNVATSQREDKSTRYKFDAESDLLLSLKAIYNTDQQSANA